ncbi:hypothetical protein M405DRAFT_863602 [Rhizopogon salebrosus TDB-379]|nr:hypothetical protein M405DRAFT_863602 [Rhizopogon salebrosus TDB-379]
MSNCAIGSDGCLKDASEIEWFNDPDDNWPISAAANNSTQPLHPFFSGASSPATFVAGARRSGRASRPSTRIVDPDNVASSSTRGKRKAADGPATTRRVARKVIPTSSASSDDDGGHVSDGDLAEAADTEDEHAEDAYASTKAMGDADRESGATHRLKSERT